MEEGEPRDELPVGVHPLEPTQGFTIHVEGGDLEALVVGCSVEIKKLVEPMGSV